MFFLINGRVPFGEQVKLVNVKKVYRKLIRSNPHVHAIHPASDLHLLDFSLLRLLVAHP